MRNEKRAASLDNSFEGLPQRGREREWYLERSVNQEGIIRWEIFNMFASQWSRREGEIDVMR